METIEDISSITAGQYCVIVTDCDGCIDSICFNVSVAQTPGCIDSTASNYNPFATTSDSSCY